MIVVDVGNTDSVIGIYQSSKLICTYRFKSKSKKLISEIKSKINKDTIKKFQIEQKVCVISSVVPEIDKRIIYFFKKLQFKVLNINYSNIPFNIKLNIDTPKQLGADRIANIIAAKFKYGKNCLILDFGTATTFDVMKNNSYEGGIIAPGILISHDSLIKNASKLKKIKFYKTKKIIGKNTLEAMQSGFFWGYVFFINGIIKKTIAEKKYKPKLILTGGLSLLFRDQIKKKSFYEPYLTLDGLYLIGLKKYGKK